jgi:hypothetical protein
MSVKSSATLSVNFLVSSRTARLEKISGGLVSGKGRKFFPERGRFSEEKLRKRLFETFTREFAASPGREQVFAELFSKSDRLLRVPPQSA